MARVPQVNEDTPARSWEQRADLPGQSESFTAQLSWQQRVLTRPGHSEGQCGRPTVDMASPELFPPRSRVWGGGEGRPAAWWDLLSSSSAGRVEASRDETNAAGWKNSPEDCGHPQLWEGAIRTSAKLGGDLHFIATLNKYRKCTSPSFPFNVGNCAHCTTGTYKSQAGEGRAGDESGNGVSRHQSAPRSPVSPQKAPSKAPGVRRAKGPE